MNKNKKLFRPFGPLILALLAALALVPPLRAQDSERRMDSRYLFVFDTSSAMKKRLPSEEKAIDALFAISLNGQLHRNDSIGAWTFSRDLQTGEFPLKYWEPGELVQLSGNLTGFVQSRHYAHTTSFDQLIPKLDSVVHTSERLTIIIFCDGETPIKGTPIDARINSIFQQNESAMKKARQPFIIVLRSQFGQYVNFSIGTPDSVNITPFPPLPQPPAPVVAAPAPAPAPQPLIIVGSRVGTNLPPVTPSPVAPPPQMTAPAPSAPATAPANPAPPAPSPAPANPSSENSAPQNNVVQQAAVATPSTPPTNTVAAMPETTSPPAAPAPAMPAPVVTPLPAPVVAGKSHWVVISAGVVIVIGVLGYVIFRLRHRSSSSLITESLKK